MARFLRPISDVTVGDWAIAPLFSKIDEVLPSDTDLISTETGAYAEFTLDATSVSVAEYMLIRIRARNTAHDIDPKNLIVQLFDGATQIMSHTIADLNATMQTFTVNLTEPQMASITNWGNLRVRVNTVDAVVSVYAGSTSAYAGSTSVYAGQGV